MTEIDGNDTRCRDLESHGSRMAGTAMISLDSPVTMGSEDDVTSNLEAPRTLLKLVSTPGAFLAVAADRARQAGLAAHNWATRRADGVAPGQCLGHVAAAWQIGLPLPYKPWSCGD
jgi:hypothetical protein